MVPFMEYSNHPRGRHNFIERYFRRFSYGQPWAPGIKNGTNSLSDILRGAFEFTDVRWCLTGRWPPSIFLICSGRDLEYLVLTPGIRNRSGYFPSHDFVQSGKWCEERWCLVRCGRRNTGPAGPRAPSWQNNSLVFHPLVQSQLHLQAVGFSVWDENASSDTGAP